METEIMPPSHTPDGKFAKGNKLATSRKGIPNKMAIITSEILNVWNEGGGYEVLIGMLHGSKTDQRFALNLIASVLPRMKYIDIMKSTSEPHKVIIEREVFHNAEGSVMIELEDVLLLIGLWENVLKEKLGGSPEIRAVFNRIKQRHEYYQKRKEERNGKANKD